MLYKLLLLFGVLFSIFLFSSGCSSAISKVYGLKKNEYLNDSTIIESAKGYGIEAEKLYKLDLSYLDTLSELAADQNHSSTAPYLQPLQVLYFSSDGKLISAHMNCFAGGFPNLNWNKKGVFDVWIPPTSAPINSLITLDLINHHIKALSSIPSNASSDTTVVIFYANFMNRQTKRFLELVKDNIKLAPNPKQALYVNMDNAYYQKEW